MSVARSNMVDQLSTNCAVLVCSSRRLNSDGREEAVTIQLHRLLLVGICMNTANFIFTLYYILNINIIVFNQLYKLKG